MNKKNETGKKDLCLAYSQGNNTAYLPNIEAMARYLSTQYSNNKPANQCEGKKGDKKKGDESKSKDKDSNMGGTAGAHVEDTTTTEESTVPSRAPSIGAHETNVQSSNSPRTMEEILGAHPMDDDEFWSNTNLTDMFIDTTNNEEMMAESHITEFHTPKHKEPFTTELLNKVLNVPEVTHKHDAGRGHHNQSDPSSTKSVDCKNPTCKDESFSSNAIGNGNITKNIGKNLDMAEGIFRDMLRKSSYLKTPTIVKDSNETTDENKMGDLKPTGVDENNNDSVEHANTVLKPNNILGIHVLEEEEEWFYQWTDNYDVWNNDSYTPTKGIKMGDSCTFTGDTGVFTLTKTKHNGKSKTRIVSGASTSNKSDFYISKRQS